MKDFNLTEVFCEVISGLALIFATIPTLDVFGLYSLESFVILVREHFTGTIFGLTLVVAYVLGLVVDAIGLTVGDLFLDKLVYRNSPTQAERENFWKDVQDHVLKYREVQWAYYSCYRNLFCLFIPAGVFWTLTIARRFQLLYISLAIILFALSELAFFVSMRSLLKIYYEITKNTGPTNVSMDVRSH